MPNHEMKFDTDVARLLDIVANALYTNRDVFLRELISNAADACDRLRYDALQNPDLTKGDTDFRIHITVDTDKNTMTIADNGIGMNREDLIENLGTIARSGTAAIMEQMKESSGDLSLIGQFGVGFYACFMVADKARVISKKAGDEQTWVWDSDGRTGYDISEATDDDKTALLSNRGTSIVLSLKDSAYDFKIYDKIKQVVLAYSDHVDVPVYIGNPKEGEEAKPANTASALWTRPKNEITPEQYTEFYHHIGYVFDEPILTSHWKAEGKIEYTALLFAPSLRPFDLYDPTRKHSVRLYVKRVFITDDCEGLIYPWMRFLRGVIDSEDLPLNISREMLQMNPVIDTIRRNVTKRILSDLHKLSQNDKEAFESFWHQFGMCLKEGLYDAVEHRSDIFKICRFFSSDKPNALMSLEDYVANMKEGQDAIYYMSGDNVETVKNSPQLEGFKARGINVIFMVDTVDEFWLQNATEYNGKRFQSITKGHVDLNKFDSNKKDDKERTETQDEKSNDKTSRIDELIAAFKEELKDQVDDVRISTRLTESPVCLVAPEQGVDMHMESVLKIQQKYEATTKPVLEINKGHPLFQKLGSLLEDKATITDAAWLLLDQARIIQGQSLPDPAAFARRMSAIMEKGLAA